MLLLLLLLLAGVYVPPLLVASVPAGADNLACAIAVSISFCAKPLSFKNFVFCAMELDAIFGFVRNLTVKEKRCRMR